MAADLLAREKNTVAGNVASEGCRASCTGPGILKGLAGRCPVKVPAL